MSDLVSRLTAALADRYRLERELVGGGMSRVWVATETALDRQVVIKVIAPELSEGLSAERFTREVRLAARLQQANIVPVLSAGTAAGLPYYTMPYVRGESLRARLKSGSPLTLTESVSILRDVARALAYAHDEGVVHRDIKPENVLISHSTAVVTDFGIAKAISAARTQDGGAAVTLTQAGGAIGTPAYMAPEQGVGDAVDHRTDLYAWGILAYELVSGAHPFGRHITPQQLITAHLTEIPAPLASKHHMVPPALAVLVLQCLEKDPARRPTSAAEVLNELDTVSTPTGPRPIPAAPAPRRWRVEALVAAGVIVVAAAIAVWALRPGRAATAPRSAAEQSLAVLPLANLSGDKADDYFGIGLAEEITRAVAKNGVRVIGRVSAGALQAKGLDERAIARELGVSSLLTGTVQRAEGQVRISVTLLSAADGAVRWTEKYDRPLANVFAVQDEITTRVVGMIGSSDAPLWRSQREAELREKRPDSLEAYECVLLTYVFYDTFAAKEHARARDCLERAVRLAPDYSTAWSRLAFMYVEEHKYRYNARPQPLERALAATQKAIELDAKNQDAYYALAIIRYMREKDFDAFQATAEQALVLNPNDAWVISDLGTWMAYSGEWERGKALVRKAMVLNPLHQRWLHFPFFLDHYRKGEYREARTIALKINLPENHMVQAGLAAVYGQLGETEKAKATLDHVLAIHPKFAEDPRAAFVARRMPRDLVEAIMDGLRKAGLDVPPGGQ